MRHTHGARGPPCVQYSLVTGAAPPASLKRTALHLPRLSRPQAKDARDVCMRLGGAGLTLSRLEESKASVGLLRQFNQMFEPMRAQNTVRLLRLKEVGPQQLALPWHAGADPALQAEDAAWEARTRPRLKPVAVCSARCHGRWLGRRSNL